MKHSDFQFLSSNHKIMIKGTLWEPETTPKALLYISHGITEHIGRYEEFARYFTERGYVVAGHDNLGHGRSMDEKNPLPTYFGPKGSWQFILNDIKTGIALMKDKFSEIPFCLMGLSVGSFATRCLLGEEPEIVDAAIIAGTGQMTSAELGIAGAICRLEEYRFGDEKNTSLLQKLTMDLYNQRIKPRRTAADWLCANPEAVDEYIADPLCGDGFTVSSFRELLYGMKVSGAREHFEKMNKNLPILLISGKEDPVGDYGKKVEEVKQIMDKLHFKDVEMKLFEGMRHDIYHEKEYIKVQEYIEGWLEARL